jgi:hypothetical protein
LKLASQRLGQLQERLDSQSTVTKRDVATLLQQGNVAVARAKAQRLLDDDMTGDLIELLEMHIGLLIEHFQELENRYVVISRAMKSHLSDQHNEPHRSRSCFQHHLRHSLH